MQTNTLNRISKHYANAPEWRYWKGDTGIEVQEWRYGNGGMEMKVWEWRHGNEGMGMEV